MTPSARDTNTGALRGGSLEVHHRAGGHGEWARNGSYDDNCMVLTWPDDAKAAGLGGEDGCSIVRLIEAAHRPPIQVFWGKAAAKHTPIPIMLCRACIYPAYVI